jgi:hypothetical protein
MASGAPVVQVLFALPPGTSYATEDIRAGGSSPAESFHVWDFDDASAEYVDFLCFLRGYDGGGLTFTIPWSATTATTGTVRWEIAIRRLDDDVEDIDTSHTYDYNGVSDTTASASGELSYPTVTFTNGTDMDSWANGELAIVRLRRDPAHVDDNLSGDAEAHALEGRET